MAATPADRERALAALAANAAVLPGTGSLLLGRRAGWAQAALALSGFALTVSWVVLVLGQWWREGALPPGEVPRPGLLLAGLGLFAAAWLWALATSLDALRRTSAK